MSFSAFRKSEPAIEIFGKLGLSEILEQAESWRSLREAIVAFNGADQGNFVKKARALEGVASSGERILLHAILYVTDFAWLADEFAGGAAWQSMHKVYGAWRLAVAYCIMADI